MYLFSCFRNYLILLIFTKETLSGQCVLGWGVFWLFLGVLFFFVFFWLGGGGGCIVNIRTFIYLIKNYSGWKYTVVFNQLNSRYRIKIEVKTKQ